MKPDTSGTWDGEWKCGSHAAVQRLTTEQRTLFSRLLMIDVRLYRSTCPTVAVRRPRQNTACIQRFIGVREPGARSQHETMPFVLVVNITELVCVTDYCNRPNKNQFSSNVDDY